mmetsp:Transcript_11852/g.35477  ORF Transcript_11852/g.35477 Transcript_11852/m.35477 type:complete len:232 (+) Transcript_11852:320-1015(+)
MVQATQQWSGDPVGKTMELQQWHVAVQPCRFPHQQGIARLTTGYPSRWPKIGPSDWTAKDIIRVYREHTSAILCSEARNGFLSPKEPFARSQDQLAVEVGECNTEGLEGGHEGGVEVQHEQVLVHLAELHSHRAGGARGALPRRSGGGLRRRHQRRRQHGVCRHQLIIFHGSLLHPAVEVQAVAPQVVVPVRLLVPQAQGEPLAGATGLAGLSTHDAYRFRCHSQCQSCYA